MPRKRQYRTYICGTTGAEYDLGPPRPDEFAAKCPKAHEHTPMPRSDLARSDWMARMRRTHRQTVHPECGLWVVWVPRQTNW